MPLNESPEIQTLLVIVRKVRIMFSKLQFAMHPKQKDAYWELCRSIYEIDHPEHPDEPPTKAEEAIKKYLTSGYCRCPYPDCESEDIEGSFVEIDSNGAHQGCSCNKCNRSWNDIYTLTSVELNEPVE